MKDLLETMVALGMILAFLCVPFVIGLLFLPVAVLGTVGDVSYMFYFVKNNLEPITRDIINKFVDLHIETGKNLEQLAQSIDDDFFNSFPI